MTRIMHEKYVDSLESDIFSIGRDLRMRHSYPIKIPKTRQNRMLSDVGDLAGMKFQYPCHKQATSAKTNRVGIQKWLQSDLTNSEQKLNFLTSQCVIGEDENSEAYSSYMDHRSSSWVA